MNQAGNAILKGYFYKCENDSLVIFNYRNKVSLQGETSMDILKVLPFLNGNHSNDEIALETDLPAEYVTQIIETLYQNHIVTYIKNIEHFGQSLNFEISVLEKLSHRYVNEYDEFIEDNNHIFSKKIKILGNNKLSEHLASQLKINYNVIVSSDEKADLIIAIDYYENEDLFRSSELLAVQHKVPFMRVIVNNLQMHIGPIFIPFEGPCYECYLSRLYSNYIHRDLQRNYGELHHKIDDNTLASLPGVADLLSGFIKNQLVKLFSQYLQSDIVSYEYVYNQQSLDSSLSPVFKLPGCKACRQSMEARL